MITHHDRKELLDGACQKISLTRQAELLNISRSSIYYTPVPEVSEGEKKIMDVIDTIYTECPFYGTRRIRYELKRDHEISIGRERVGELMKIMGLKAIYPKPHTSTSHAQHKKYPYLLKGIQAQKPNHIWGTDITYIRLEKGWMYLVAFIDWFSRYVLSWKLSPTLENTFCIEALEEALEHGRAAIHNSDQGSQFTDEEYIKRLHVHGIQISMDGRGRCMDNIFTERLWRSVKYEDVYIKSYQNRSEAREGLRNYFHFYNYRRPHQSLNYQTPAEVYFG